MKTLFVVSNSPFKRRDPLFYLKLADARDSVIFIQDGIYAAKGMPTEIKEEFEKAKQRGVNFYFLEEDLIARGFEHCCDENTVDYDQFLELIENHDRVVH